MRPWDVGEPVIREPLWHVASCVGLSTGFGTGPVRFALTRSPFCCIRWFGSPGGTRTRDPVVNSRDQVSSQGNAVLRKVETQSFFVNPVRRIGTSTDGVHAQFTHSSLEYAPAEDFHDASDPPARHLEAERKGTPPSVPRWQLAVGEPRYRRALVEFRDTA